jgi:hypothetical protein
VLAEHRRRLEERCAALGGRLPADAYLFSLAPDGSTHLRPNSVSERYSGLADRLGIATSLHKLRHYDARSTWLAHVAGTRAAAEVSEAILAERHAGDEPEERVTADEWLAAERASRDDGDARRMVPR